MFYKKVSQTEDKYDNNIIAEGVNIEGRIYSPRPIKIDGTVDFINLEWSKEDESE